MNGAVVYALPPARVQGHHGAAELIGGDIVTFKLLLSACIVVGSSMGAARANDSWKVDPPDYWRKMTLDDETSTSKCVGRLNSPICAMETKEACNVRGDNALCQKAVTDAEGRVFIRSPERSPNIWWSYRFSKVKKVAAGERILVGTTEAQPGDYIIDRRDRMCYINENKCDKDIGPATTHLVRRLGDEWRIITWYTPRW